MLLRQIRYYQKVVECGSFTIAADECHISQSAISQQIKALEEELGYPLLERKNRAFELTPAGRFFYEKSLGITRQLDKLCEDTKRIANNEDAKLRLGYLKNYGGTEFRRAVAEFSARYPKVDISVFAGTHEELYARLHAEEIDLAMNDQWRAFSVDYNNVILTEQKGYIEVPQGSFPASLEKISVEELDNETCVLVTSKDTEDTDRAFYRDILGFRSQFITAYSLEDARMMVLAGKGYLPIEGNSQIPDMLTRVPLYRMGRQVYRRYCAFWKLDNSGYYVEEFAEILQKQFQ
jgi:DNA-binding transcriptional LysR family regulator